jgi:hypothetical protein
MHIPKEILAVLILMIAVVGLLWMTKTKVC